MMSYVLAFTFGIMVGWVLCERQLEEEYWTDIKPDDDFNDVM